MKGETHLDCFDQANRIARDAQDFVGLCLPVPLRNITATNAGPVATMDETLSEIVKDNPIGGGLDSFRSVFRSTCESKGIRPSPDSMDCLNEKGEEALPIM